MTFLNYKFVEPDKFSLNYSFAIPEIKIHKVIDRKSLLRRKKIRSSSHSKYELSKLRKMVRPHL